MIEADELAVDPRFSENALRTQHYEQLQPLMFAATRRKPRDSTRRVDDLVRSLGCEGISKTGWRR